MRQYSHSSSISSSISTPKNRRSFFKKRSSRDDSNSDKSVDPLPSDKVLSSPFSPEFELTRSNNGLPSPDSFIAATQDTVVLHENIRRLRKAPAGPEPKNVDAVWEVYKKLREDSLEICKRLLQKSQNNGRDISPLETSTDPLDNQSSYSVSVTETSVPFHISDSWLSAIHEYKATQEAMLDNLRTSLLSTYKAYEPNTTESQREAFLDDKELRKNLVTKWRDTSVHRMKSEKLLFWEKYKIRSLNFDRLRLDLSFTQSLLDVADSEVAPNLVIREYVIASNGDTILEFANSASEIHPILRFRVSSHLLAEASPLFSKILSSTQLRNHARLDTIAEFPPPPSLHTCKDGMEVRVYRMPQIELNNHDALTILLHAAHMHNSTVPREISFPAFVSIAEVCLRYQCTSPLELQVEYQWLPQWIHMASDDNPDGLLIISYVFGLRRLFTRSSKTAILNALDENEIQGKEFWPQVIKDKINAVRSAKLAQIHECCTNAVEEYLRPPLEDTGRRATVGDFVLTASPRCPKGSHICDATNLGWLMLVYNELQVLPSIIKSVGLHNLTKPPSRSLKELAECLRLMPSPPQVHSGVCDYAPAFRDAINDIYNSITGLTLRDVSGRNGWALSKHAGPTGDRYDDISPELHDFPVLVYERENKKPFAISNEAICLRILSHLENLDDLNAAAMIDKRFYGAYKRNEALLLKNVMKAERRRTMSQASPDIKGLRNNLGRDELAPSSIRTPPPKGIDESKDLTSYNIVSTPSAVVDASDDDLYNAPRDHSPTIKDEVVMSAEEAQQILWPNDDSSNNAESGRATTSTANWQRVEPNEKFLVGDVVHIEDKARMGDDGKYLRDEKDKAFGPGIRKHNVPSAI